MYSFYPAPQTACSFGFQEPASVEVPDMSMLFILGMFCSASMPFAVSLQSPKGLEKYGFG